MLHWVGLLIHKYCKCHIILFIDWDYVKVRVALFSWGCNQLVIIRGWIDCSPIKNDYPLLNLCAFKVETCFNTYSQVLQVS